MTATTTKAPEVKFKLGKLPARPDAVKLKMTRYLVPADAAHAAGQLRP